MWEEQDIREREEATERESQDLEEVMQPEIINISGEKELTEAG